MARRAALARLVRRIARQLGLGRPVGVVITQVVRVGGAGAEVLAAGLQDRFDVDAAVTQLGAQRRRGEVGGLQQRTEQHGQRDQPVGAGRHRGQGVLQDLLSLLVELRQRGVWEAAGGGEHRVGLVAAGAAVAEQGTGREAKVREQLADRVVPQMGQGQAGEQIHGVH
ncbi:MAG: hypothetical protein ACRDRQ_03535 [Pseudonocardiaceae bacterium]